MKRLTAICGFVACLAASLMTASVTWGQFRLDIDAVAGDSAQASDEVTGKSQLNDDAIRAKHIALQVDRRAALMQRQLHNQLYSRYGSKDGAQQHFDKELESWIDRLDSLHSLTLTQRSKLWLAGNRDIQAVFQKTDEFAAITRVEDVLVAVRKIKELKIPLENGVCADGSLLSIVAKKVLADETEAKHQVAEDQVAYSNQAAIKMAIAEFESFVPLTMTQRTALYDFLVEKRELRRRASKCNVLGGLSAIKRTQEDLGTILTKQQLDQIPDAVSAATSRLLQRIKLEPAEWQP